MRRRFMFVRQLVIASLLSAVQAGANLLTTEGSISMKAILIVALGALLLAERLPTAGLKP
jgi:hypothetical protein